MGDCEQMLPNLNVSAHTIIYYVQLLKRDESKLCEVHTPRET